MHPGKIRFACRHRACIAFKTVIVLVVVVPKRAANIDGIVADGKLKSAADGNALWQINGEGEAVGGSVIGVEHVAGHKVVKRNPIVGRVTDGHLLAEAQVRHTNDARYGPVMIANKASAKITNKFSHTAFNTRQQKINFMSCVICIFVINVILNQGFKKLFSFSKKPNPEGFIAFYWAYMSFWFFKSAFTAHIADASIYHCVIWL